MNNVLKSIISTLRTAATIVAIYGIYSALAAFNIELPTLQQLLSNPTIAWNKSPKQQSETIQICELIALGYQVTDASGVLELCIKGKVSK
ncbi:MAG: hypothetical protein ACRC1U_11085 [Vibrionaceae bacterium]